MSGHSKWANIKNRKEAQDKKKTAAFTRITREIIAAAKINPDPESPRLATAIERARAVNLPNANIERAIKRAQGLGDEGALESLSYDAVGPHGTAFIIDVSTDNKNRTVAEVRHILTKHGGNIAQTGAVRWQFTQKGFITLQLDTPLTDEIALIIIEAGAEDIQKTDNNSLVRVITAEKDLASVATALNNKDLNVTEQTLGWLANEPKELDEATLTSARELAEALDNHPDVTQLAANFIL